MRRPRQLLHSEWFDHALQELGALPQIESLLAEELYRIALYADLVPVVPGGRDLRVYQTLPFLRVDGQLIRIVIYFVLRSDDTVELQHIEVAREDMGA